jgi:hypothetical protein
VEADPRAAAILALREARAEQELSTTISPAAEAWPGLDNPAHDLASRRQALARFQAAEYRDQRQVS